MSNLAADIELMNIALGPAQWQGESLQPFATVCATGNK